MKTNEIKALLPKLLSDAESAVTIASAAESSKQSLAGSSRYADRFHEVVIRLTSAENRLRPHLSGQLLTQEEGAEFDSCLQVIKANTGKAKTRKASLRKLTLLCETVIIPKSEGMTASPIPSTEGVLPLDVVKGNWVLEKIVTQVNGCYEHQWYDACSVMVRKLAEILIIAVFEKKGVPQEIKDGDDNFLMLSKLIAKLEAKTAWGLGRETKPFLKLMKELGDRSAHNRTYVATKADVDKLLGGLRVAVTDLMVQGGLKDVKE